MITDEHKQNILAAAALLRRAESLTRGAHSLLDEAVRSIDWWELGEAADQAKSAIDKLDRAWENAYRTKKFFECGREGSDD